MDKRIGYVTAHVENLGAFSLSATIKVAAIK